MAYEAVEDLGQLVPLQEGSWEAHRLLDVVLVEFILVPEVQKGERSLVVDAQLLRGVGHRRDLTHFALLRLRALLAEQTLVILLLLLFTRVLPPVNALLNRFLLTPVQNSKSYIQQVEQCRRLHALEQLSFPLGDRLVA